MTVPAHGTQKAAYTGCECEACSAGRQRRCGTVLGYKEWGCRCDRCRAAATRARTSTRRRSDTPTGFYAWLDTNHPDLAHTISAFINHPGDHPYELRTGPAQWEYDLLASRRLAETRAAHSRDGQSSQVLDTRSRMGTIST